MYRRGRQCKVSERDCDLPAHTVSSPGSGEAFGSGLRKAALLFPETVCPPKRGDKIPQLLQITFSHRDPRSWSGVQHSSEPRKAQTKADHVPEEMVAIYNCLNIYTSYYMKSSCEKEDYMGNSYSKVKHRAILQRH